MLRGDPESSPSIIIIIIIIIELLDLNPPYIPNCIRHFLYLAIMSWEFV